MAVAASALVSLAANRPAGNLALKALGESERGKRRREEIGRQAYGQTEGYTCMHTHSRTDREKGKRRTFM